MRHSSYFASWELRRAVIRPPRRVGRWLVGAAAVLALVVAMTAISAWRGNRTSRTDLARQFVNDYGAAIPRWQADHPGRSCPGAVGELTKYTPRNHDVRDPWGDELQLVCTPKGIVVYSLGGDGHPGTAQMLWSGQ